MEIVLIIPVYNEESTIKKVIEEVLLYVKKIIVVNDCSTDNSEKILKKLPITLINNPRNLGYVKTLEKGIKFAFNNEADYVITFDADDQHQAIDLKKIIKIIQKKKPDLLVGTRSHKNRFMEDIFGLWAKIKYKISDPLCGLKAYKRELFKKYDCLEKKYSLGTELIFRAIKDGANFIEIPIKCKKRQALSRFAGNLKGNLLELRAFINMFFI